MHLVEEVIDVAEHRVAGMVAEDHAQAQIRLGLRGGKWNAAK